MMIRNPLPLLSLFLVSLFADLGAADKKVVFVAGAKSHGYFSHEHIAGCKLLAKHLDEAKIGLKSVVVTDNGYPKDPSVFDDAVAIVVYCDGGGRHLLNAHLKEFDKIMKRGVGLACLHYGVEVPKGAPGDHFLKWIGGYFETNWSVNPHWTAGFKLFPNHPISSGVKPFAINDEWYYHMRFREAMEGVTPILSALPSADTLKRKDGAHSNNPHVRKSVLERKEAQHVAWAYQRGKDYSNGRGFGFTGGHNHVNWGSDNFRKLVLNGIAWIAKTDVPSKGVVPGEVSVKGLQENQDYPPRGWAPEQIETKLKEFNGRAPKKGASVSPKKPSGSSKAKPLFASKVVTAQTPGQGIDVSAEIKGVKELHLYISDAGNGYGCDWADWVNPRLVDASGKEAKLASMKWKFASSGWGRANLNKNASGGPMKVEGKSVQGIGCHANSLISYQLPANHKFTRFLAKGALDDGGARQGACGNQASVQFYVYSQKPKVLGGVKLVSGPKGSGKRIGDQGDPAHAVDNLDVHEKVKATLFASEPMILSPSAIDIDHRGRVWVCEVTNYRRHKNKREEGDRILILEDTDGDNKADKVKTFYQGRDIDSAHGVSVFGDKVIIAVGDRVVVFTDKDGDDKPDSKENLFTGISGTQHDHGIHAVHFGPDGKFYFNFGNNGRQIKDKDGKPIVDQAGNEVNDKRKPYQQGMVFRCNEDGSDFETLGWNFRNNWEVTVDSFGTVWQSDNDDDGNRGVRINYVMEFGNYGYKGEFTGKGWRDARTNIETEIPLRHWRLNDPGVMPNLLQTGAGSPTGITVYEGTLLPPVFHGQVIHCDAGPSVVRAYPVSKNGAGFDAEVVDILNGASRDKWFRPSDVVTAPDGSLMVADWYDPGVGGHNMQDLGRGRLFMVAPEGHKYKSPKVDVSTVDGSISALRSPNEATRYLAWHAIRKSGRKAEPALQKLFADKEPRIRARALWLLGKIEGRGKHYVDLAIRDKDSDIRIVGLRLARQLSGLNTLSVVEKLVSDKSSQVRRECAIALRHEKTSQAARLWAELAARHDGKDRWYLEALGLSSDLNADACFDAWIAKVGEKWNTPAGRDVIWRVRAKVAPSYLVNILKDEKTPAETHPRYVRALDFHSGPEKDKALESLLDI
jgi:putative membrane-bound dehydrogenase-like protein